VLSALPAARKESVSPKDFGAIGDGRANDIEAVNAAIAHALSHGLPIDGGSSDYGVSGNIEVRRRTRPSITQLRLKQLRPARDRVTLAFVDCEEVHVDRLYIHVGTSAAVGHMDVTTGLLIQGGSGHKIRSVTLTGDGNVTYARFRECTDSRFEDVHVHDGKFENFETEQVRRDGGPPATIRVLDDVVQGIHMADCRRCNLVDPVIRNLTGNATYFNTANAVKDYPNFRTRGIAGGGNIDCTVANPMVSNVEQAIDFSGSGNGWGNRNVQVIGGLTVNCGSVGVKFANAPNGCKAIGHTARNCGMMGFMLTGQSPSIQAADNSFIGCEAINPGYNDVQFDTDTEALAHSGFYLMSSLPGGLVGGRIATCRAIDNQGFYLAGDDSPWAGPGATSAQMAEAWTGYSGTYPATFTTSAGVEGRTVTLTSGSTAVSWAKGLAGSITHPFVSRPAKMQYGALCEARYSAPPGAPNTIESFQSLGHTKVSAKGFHGEL
jgi:hypothetical protein